GMLLAPFWNVSVRPPVPLVVVASSYIAMFAGIGIGLVAVHTNGVVGGIEGTTASTLRSWTWPDVTCPDGRTASCTSSCLSVMVYLQYMLPVAEEVPPNVTGGTSAG